MCLSDISDIASIVVAAAALIAIAFSVLAWRVSKRTLKHQLINSLYGEYKSEDMYLSVKALNDDFRYATAIAPGETPTSAHTRSWIDYYKRQYKKDANKTLHCQRRNVSIFYQKMAYLAMGDRYLRRFVKKMWGKREVFVVRYIILPVETVAIPELFGDKEKDEPPIFAFPMKLIGRTFTSLKRSDVRNRKRPNRDHKSNGSEE